MQPVSREDSLTVDAIAKSMALNNPKLEETEMDSSSPSKEEDPTSAIDSKDEAQEAKTSASDKKK